MLEQKLHQQLRYMGNHPVDLQGGVIGLAGAKIGFIGVDRRSQEGENDEISSR